MLENPVTLDLQTWPLIVFTVGCFVFHFLPVASLRVGVTNGARLAPSSATAPSQRSATPSVDTATSHKVRLLLHVLIALFVSPFLFLTSPYRWRIFILSQYPWALTDLLKSSKEVIPHSSVKFNNYTTRIVRFSVILLTRQFFWLMTLAFGSGWTVRPSPVTNKPDHLSYTPLRKWLCLIQRWFNT